MNIEIQRVERLTIDNDTAKFLRDLVDKLARVACDLGDPVYEVDNLCEAIEEFLACNSIGVE